RYTARPEISRPCRRTAPPWSVVWPIIVVSSVLLPTPLRPMIDNVPPSASVSLISSSTTVSPYPAKTASSSSTFLVSAKARSTMGRSAADATAFLPEIDRPHLLVRHDFMRRDLGENRAGDQHRDPAREANHDVHVVLDNQDGDVRIEAFHHIENEMTLRRRDAGSRLVQQQHARLLRQRNRNLDQPLAVIGQFAHHVERIVDEPQRCQMIEGFVDHNPAAT